MPAVPGAGWVGETADGGAAAAGIAGPSSAIAVARAAATTSTRTDGSRTRLTG